jgi:hypothetical protein
MITHFSAHYQILHGDQIGSDFNGQQLCCSTAALVLIGQSLPQQATAAYHHPNSHE